MPLEHVLEVEGAKIATREWQGDGSAILLLHGLASSARIWDLVAPRLRSRGFRVVAYDQRGHGGSSKPRSDYGFDAVTADATAVIRRLRLRRPVVVGHSWGANVALELAVREPRRLAGAVLLDGGFLRMRDRYDWPTAKRVLAPPPIDGMPVEDFLRKARAMLDGQVRPRPEIDRLFLSIVRVDRRGRIHRQLSVPNHLRILRAIWEQDTGELLGRLRVPTLVLGARDPRGAADSAGYLDAKRRGAMAVRELGEPLRFEWIRAIHDVPLHRPEALTRRIERFARDVVG